MTWTLAIQIGGLAASLVTFGFIVSAELWRAQLARMRKADLDALKLTVAGLLDAVKYAISDDLMAAERKLQAADIEFCRRFVPSSRKAKS